MPDLNPADCAHKTITRESTETLTWRCNACPQEFLPVPGQIFTDYQLVMGALVEEPTGPNCVIRSSDTCASCEGTKHRIGCPELEPEDELDRRCLGCCRDCGGSGVPVYDGQN